MQTNHNMFIRNPIYAISYILKFIWKTVPSAKELVIYSGLQSLLEIIFDIDRGFGTNPVEKSFIRDVGKIPGEVLLVNSYTNYGDTRYWHDKFSLVSTIQKPISKIAVIRLYERYHKPDIYPYIDWLEKSLYYNYNGASLKISKQVQHLLSNYLSEGIISKGARLSNFIGEPISRIIDECSKIYQDDIYGDFIQHLMQSRNMLQNIAENLLINDPTIKSQMANFIAERDLGLMGVVDSLILQRGLINVLPIAVSNAMIKTSGLDYLGDVYGKLGIKENFKSVREYLDIRILDLVINDIVNLKGLSFYEKKSAISSVEDLDILSIGLITGLLFLTELAEKTAYNVLTMALLSTPGKTIGNALHFADKAHPYLFKSVGVVVGTYYIKKVLEAEPTKHTFSSFVKENKNLHLTHEEQCYVDYFDKILALNDHSLPLTHDVISKAEHLGLLELSGCLNFYLEGA